MTETHEQPLPYRANRPWYDFEDNKDRAAVMAVIAAVGGFALLGKLTGQFDPKGPPKGHDRVYIARPTDTEWTIAQRAYPHLDPREVIGMINSQEPLANRKNHVVVPGEKFYFAEDSSLGQETKPTK